MLAGLAKRSLTLRDIFSLRILLRLPKNVDRVLLSRPDRSASPVGDWLSWPDDN
jgi:hypothetical protein